MDRTVLSRDHSKIVQVHSDGEQLITHTVQDASHIVKENKELRSGGHNKAAHGRIGARVPIALHMQWVKEWRNNHADKWTLSTFLAMKVNSRDYSYLRTTDGKL